MIQIEQHYIALVTYADGEKRYIIAPDGLKVGDVLCQVQMLILKLEILYH